MVQASAAKTKGSNNPLKPDFLRLDVFDSQGKFLLEIPLTVFADKIKIHNDKLYLIDTIKGMQIHEYDIIDNN